MDLNKRKMTNHLHSPAEFPNEPNVPYNPSTYPVGGDYHICIIINNNSYYY